MGRYRRHSGGRACKPGSLLPGTKVRGPPRSHRPPAIGRSNAKRSYESNVTCVKTQSRRQQTHSLESGWMYGILPISSESGVGHPQRIEQYCTTVCLLASYRRTLGCPHMSSSLIWSHDMGVHSLFLAALHHSYFVLSPRMLSSPATHVHLSVRYWVSTDTSPLVRFSAL